MNIFIGDLIVNGSALMMSDGPEIVIGILQPTSTITTLTSNMRINSWLMFALKHYAERGLINITR